MHDNTVKSVDRVAAIMRAGAACDLGGLPLAEPLQLLRDVARRLQETSDLTGSLQG